MTWTEFGIKSNVLKCAAVLAAHLLCAASAVAQDVTFRSADNAVVVAGRFVGFDGDVVSLATDDGLLSFRAADMVCDGDACPNLAAYVPRLRVAGAARMGDVLLPALIDVYARDHGWSVQEDVSGFRLFDADGTEAMAVLLQIAPINEAFDLFLRSEADALLSMRELRGPELDRAQEAGLGRLNRARQGRILALDALVPVVSSDTGAVTISMAELIETLAGGEGAVFDVHLPVDHSGQLAGFEDRFMVPSGLSLGAREGAHGDIDAALRVVEEAENGLTLMPFGSTGLAQPLALSGPCGLQSDARYLTMKTEDYPLTFPMFLYLPQRNQHPRITEFLDWLRSPAAQLVIRRAGFVDLSAVPIPLANQGERLASAITAAGEEIPLAELQRMVRFMTPRVRMSTTFRFEPGSTRLDGQSRSNVMQLAQAIRDGRFTARELTFVGFSDGRGPAAANRDLSSARAEAVHRAVERALGGRVPESVTMQIDAFGEALPMACDDTVWGQQTNRRVELWVQDGG